MLPALSCTLTGFDDDTPLDAFHALPAVYPAGMLEWGVLYSTVNQGNGRYPSLRRIETLARYLAQPGAPRAALHVCGSAVFDLINGVGHVSELAHHFPRVQLNFHADRYPLEAVQALLQRHSGQTVITQHNAANETLWRALAEHPNHAVLFDASGGRGELPAAWPEPLPGVRCGYAGGLGPATLYAELPRILAAAGSEPLWVDMATRLRDPQDRFDLRRARSCLDIVEQFL